MKDYCTLIPDTIQGVDIGTTCCKQHDIDVGEAGTYNPVSPHIKFYNCLKSKGITFGLRSIIAIGGAIGSFVRYPYFVWRKYKYRKGLKK